MIDLATIRIDAHSTPWLKMLKEQAKAHGTPWEDWPFIACEGERWRNVQEARCFQKMEKSLVGTAKWRDCAVELFAVVTNALAKHGKKVQGLLPQPQLDREEWAKVVKTLFEAEQSKEIPDWNPLLQDVVQLNKQLLQDVAHFNKDHNFADTLKSIPFIPIEDRGLRAAGSAEKEELIHIYFQPRRDNMEEEEGEEEAVQMGSLPELPPLLKKKSPFCTKTFST